MKNKILFPIIWLLVLIVSFVPSGCKKFVEVEIPSTQKGVPTVFADDNTANAAVAGMYSQMYHLNFTSSTYGGVHLSIYVGMYADELNRPSLPSDVYLNNTIPSNDGQNENLWDSSYAAIYQANLILEGLNTSSSISSSMKKQLTGEALFIRAFCHFYLANIYGGVPVVTTTNVEENRLAPRKTIQEVYKQVTSDLLEAQSLLTEDYTRYFNGERVRATKWAATAMLARVYLYEGKWDDAETQSTMVINNSGLFDLLADLNSVFLRNSKEAIWQFMSYDGGGWTIAGAQYIPRSGAPMYTLTNTLYNAFEANDKRKLSWVKTTTVSGQAYNAPSKYKQRAANTGNTVEYDMVLRIAEQYFIRAEARAQKGDLGTATTGSKGDLNKIRLRAGLAVTAAQTKEEILNAVWQERRIELFSEWGHRWYDLKRTNKVNDVLSAVKPQWKTSAILFPIPAAEIFKNPNLEPNPGYE